MENQTANNTNVTGDVTEQQGLPADKIIICVVFYIIVIVTIVGNVLVLMAIKAEKRLQTLFSYYIINLAVTDIAVAVTAMSFYTLDVTLGYWPFGEIMCAIWIFCDYGMTFASVFTLIAISLDRFWSVTWSLHYRTHHTRKKCLIIIGAIWLFMLVLWLPPCVVDRIRHRKPGVCIWEPSLNREFVIVIAVVGHHGAFLVLMFCYIRVLLFMRRRRVNVIEKQKVVNPDGVTLANKQLSVIDVGESFMRTGPANERRTEVSTGRIQVHPEQLDVIVGTSERSKSSHNSRDRKVFVTLTYIIAGYVICWLPFHIVFDVSCVSPDLVPKEIYTMTFWMTYLNSTLNPFLYNFSSKELRHACLKVLSGRCRTP
ncbi:muscarinic acetylcholine receptor M4-like [Liolophura sinensis]|uniref:muscarinic acetylcholine receptor M4-like n=1 Tax=Liolophura sinensis TaxID=3198878 RepID=UPI0031585D40